MKKILSMFLVAIMCVSLVACGGEKDSSTSDNSDNVASNHDNESEVDYEKILVADGKEWTSLHDLYFSDSVVFCEDYSFVCGDELGTWELTGTTISVTLKDDTTTSYEIKNVNDVYLLVGSYDTLAWSNIDKSTIPVKEIEVTIENWQEYFEVYSYSYETVDSFGEVSGVLEETIFRLRDEYLKYLIIESPLGTKSYTTFSYRYGSSEDDHNMDILPFSYNLEHSYYGFPMIDDNFEVTKIQGTLYFIDIE